MKKAGVLTEGPIISTLIKLSLPIMATNFIQTAYGLVDMIWIGRLGSYAVASVGTATFFINLAMALFTLVIIGTGVKIAHSLGKENTKDAEEYVRNGFLMAFVLALVYGIFILVFNKSLIGFFDLNNPVVETEARKYLKISMIGVLFMSFNNLYSNIFNSYGNSKLPFRANSFGLVMNLIIDPLFIFGLGSFKGLGVSGAAIATVLSRMVVLIIFVLNSRNYFTIFKNGFKLKLDKAKTVLKMGVPITIQRVTFISIGIIMAKIIASWGATAIGVQKIGLQIESISYMTIGGLQGAVAAFIGQNYGAKKYGRIREGYYKSLLITTIFGTIISIIFLVFPRQIFSIFISEEESIKIGIDYVRILGISQIFMCIEIFTVGAFNGIGKTYIPPFISIIFTAARIPLAIYLSQENVLGLNGIWLSITASSIIKGVLMVSLFIINMKKNIEPLEKLEEN